MTESGGEKMHKKNLMERKKRSGPKGRGRIVLDPLERMNEMMRVESIDEETPKTIE